MSKIVEELEQDYLDASAARIAAADAYRIAADVVVATNAAIATAAYNADRAYRLWQDALEKKRYG